MLRSRKARWIATGAVYALALAFLAALIAGESDAGTRTKLVETAVFVLVPAVVFVVAAGPLWRESRNRPWLAVGGVLAFVVAVALAVVTWGVGLPVSGCLFAVAIADLDRVLMLSGFRGSRRGVALAVALLIGAGFVGLALPIAAALAVVGLALLLWKLVAARPRRPVRGS